MKKILMILAAAMTLVAVSCEQTPKVVPVELKVALELDGADYPSADRAVILRELNGTVSYEMLTDETGTATFEVLPGLYEASTTFKLVEEGSVFVYNAINSNVTVKAEGENVAKLSLVVSETNQIIIKELYNGGCLADDGSKSYSNDAYLLLYNNSDQPADASDICFAFATPANSNASNKYLVDGELSYVSQGWLPAGWGTWWFTTNVTIEPYSQIVVAIFGAINHKETYSNSVDLTNADYVMYDPEVWANKKYQIMEGRPESTWLQSLAYAPGNAWTLSNSSPALYIYRNADNEAFTSNTANYDYTNGEKFPNVKIPVEWVVDGVDVFRTGSEDSNGKRLPASVDAGSVYFLNANGYSVYRNVDKAATEAIAENEGKLVYDYAGGTEDVEGTTDPSGIDAEKSIANGAKIVYMDTNNSTNDFHQRKFASLTGK